MLFTFEGPAKFSCLHCSVSFIVSSFSDSSSSYLFLHSIICGWGSGLPFSLSLSAFLLFPLFDVLLFVDSVNAVFENVVLGNAVFDNAVFSNAVFFNAVLVVAVVRGVVILVLFDSWS